MSEDTNFTKADVERIVRDLAGPIAKQVAAETAKTVSGELVAKVTTDLTRAMENMTKAMTDSITDSFRILGMDRNSEAGISRAHRRNDFIDRAIAEDKDFRERMAFVDRVREEVEFEDLTYLKALRKRSEKTLSTIHEQVLRYLVPILLGFAGVAVWHWVTDSNHHSTPVTVPAIERQAERPESASGQVAGSK